ncbi:MAG: UvrD-helicase domain-containing protein [Aerococcus sp.]|nr:UvrD-helicase domain-containing protein [Aerococcus sp.]
MTTDLLSGLNDKQREAVQLTEGPLLIQAGAGSGKTRVLTYRMAYLLQEKDVDPKRILAITFTNKAANEMKARVQQLIGEASRGMWVSTFHSMCVRILRRESEAIGISRNFTIADPAGQLSVIKEAMKRLNIDKDRFQPKMILAKISDAKNNLETPADYRLNHTGFVEEKIADCYEAYQEALEAADALDFDDLIMKTVQLFQAEPEILRYYQQKFQYIHVDEYQDTNEAQYQLVKMLGDYFKNICVVGDADQSIYGWRGANMENILNFEEDYPNCHTVLLAQNYRSTKNILAAANAVIENNEFRKPKELWTSNAEGEKVGYFEASTDSEEQQFVVDQIEDMRKEKQKCYSDFAILYRTNAQSRAMEERLVKADIPYHIVGGVKFYDRKEIKDVLAYLRLLANPNDNLSFDRIVNEPKRSVGATTKDKLYRYADSQKVSYLEAANQASALGITGRAEKGLRDFVKVIVELRQQREFLNLTELTEQVLKRSGYRQALERQNTPEAETRLENIDEFLSVTRSFDERFANADVDLSVLRELAGGGTSNGEHANDLPEEPGQTVFYAEQDLFSEMAEETDTERPDDETPSDDALTIFLTLLSLDSGDDTIEQDDEVTLMTLHAAKGLEFPVVFMIGMEEGIFPLSRAADDPEELEEERRLAYVGITRAEEKLFLTAAQSRLLYGRHQYNARSRFVEEIGMNAFDQIPQSDTLGSYHQDMAQKRQHFQAQRAYKHRQKTHLADDAKRSVFSRTGQPKGGADLETGPLWKPGDVLYHKLWGEGRVVSVKNAKGDQRLEVAFEGQGIKNIIAGFAPISREPFE